MEFPRSKSYLIDTNVLVYSVNRDSDYYLQARELLKYLSEKVDLVFIRTQISTQNIREAYRVMSYPKFPKCFEFAI